ncbi:hypothetical protein [Saccharopolyspora griseoalba]|uniref:Coagulation factor 5/8 type domain-containing protein n=1 Tax=Saccharopolyspora griseoalba TaxID=1431848 RepID=A0ABW2LPR1_9PSEU
MTPVPQRRGRRFPFFAGMAALAVVTATAPAASAAPLAKAPQPGDVRPAACGGTNTPDFGENVHVFDPSMPPDQIQRQLDADFENLKDTQADQMSEDRVAHLFMPGDYDNHINVGYYTSVAGLGKNPGDVNLNGNLTVDAFNESDEGNATQNFWRSAENMTVTPEGTNRWAVSQAAPFRRMHVKGDLDLYPKSYGWASGGYISDSVVDGTTESSSQQQWYSKDSQYGSWYGSVWNMVFSGVEGAPSTAFPDPPHTALPTTPVSRDVPYLYADEQGSFHVNKPELRPEASGPSWAGGDTPGTSVPMSEFYVAKPTDTAQTIDDALSRGCNLLFTPGVYHLDDTIDVTNPDTVVLGIGYPTLQPTTGKPAMQVADADGIRLKGLLFDAGETNSPSLLTVGAEGASADHAQNPISVQDVFFRLGGSIAGKATRSLVVNSNNTLLDHIWAWRADHGNEGTFGWDVNTGETGVTVNGDDVTATGLFVEHYQKYQTIWNGNGGTTVFYQNEQPYDVPDQASYMNEDGLEGWAAYKVADDVTSHEAWGLGSYNYFNTNPEVRNYHAFEVPENPNVKFHSLVTVSLNDKGATEHVINDTGEITPPDTQPSNVVSYP